MLPPYLIVSLRLHLIARGVGLETTYSQAFRWTLIGSFFDLVMPSSNGGDLVKVAYMAEHVGAGRRTTAMFAALVDRVLGLLGLFFLALITCVVGWSHLSQLTSRMMVLVILVFICAGSMTALYYLAHPVTHNMQLMRRMQSWPRIGPRLKQLTTSLQLLWGSPKLIASALTLSVINHIFWCTSLLCITHATGAHISWFDGFVVFPLAIFSNVFGVAGGFGLGTVGFDALLAMLLQVRDGALIGLTFQILSGLSRTVGLPIYILHRQAKTTSSFGE